MVKNKKRILTIVAAPDLTQAQAQAQNILNSDGNRAIDDILQRMRTVIGSQEEWNYEPFLERASYARDIAIKLSDFRERNGEFPDIVQIVGHGSPGRLELGQFWSRSPYDEENGYAVLDSNPDSYGMLSEWLRPKSILLLIGCSTGSVDTAGSIANGPALLFDIEQMSDVYAYASDGDVRPSDFYDGFRYNGTLNASNGRPANPLAILDKVAQKEETAHSEAASLDFTKLLSAPILGMFKRNNGLLNLPSELKKRLNKSYTLVGENMGLLAMTELELAVAGDSEPAQLICAGRYIRILRGNKTIYFAETPEVSQNPDQRKQWQQISERLSAAARIGRFE